MAYQALLFCPDEKTARTVTQVLSELDFNVAPCTEPFAAVKRLMAEHFDAIVVDCDNEQNATLLFKSAHNSANNQNSLAVAVVEGQAGVAKAFRIGANLVLTKPINVEQAKGTLRVARGLLRKGETAKPVAASPIAKPAPPKPAPRPPMPVAPRTPAPMAPPAIATPKPWVAEPQQVIASAGPEFVDENDNDEDLLNALKALTPIASATTKPAPGISSDSVPQKVSNPSVLTASGAASAPARAREVQGNTPAETTLPSLLPGQILGERAESKKAASVAEAPALAPTFTFGGNAATEAPKRGSKKALIAVVAVVLLAAAGYAAWIQFHGKFSSSAEPVTKAVSPIQAPTAKTTAPPSTSLPQAEATSSPSASTPEASTSASEPSAQRVQQVSPQPSAGESEAGPVEEEPSGAHGASSSPSKTSHLSAKPASKVDATEKLVQQPIVLKNDSSTLHVAKPAPTAEIPAPSPMVAAGTGGGSLPNLITKDTSVPRPVLQRVNVSQGVSEGLIYRKVQPVYPPSALRMRVEGPVELLATISAKGEITSVKILSGTPLLAHAAADAVKQWKYKPYLLDGKPVEMQTQITVNFKLPE